MTNNFDFIKQYNFKNNSKIIQLVEDVEKYYFAGKSDYSSIPNKIGQILEWICGDICEKENINSECDLSVQISQIRDRKLRKKHFTNNAFYQLNFYRNRFSHKNNDEISQCVCITLLEYLYEVLRYYVFEYLENDVEDEIYFSEDIYTHKMQTNFVLSETEINEDPKNLIVENEGIRANIISIVTILQKKDTMNFHIPLYQRGYKWSKGNINTFLHDIEKRVEDNSFHYFGNVACKKSVNKLVILDGQQRLTTTVLFLLAASVCLEKKTENNWIKQQYLSPSGEKKLSEVFSSLVNTDEEGIDFKEILDNPSSVIKTENNCFNTNFFFMKEYIEKNKETIEKLETFVKIFIENFKINFLDFDESDCPIKKELEIFENLNSKGKSLTGVDLIKNYLINLCNRETLEKHDYEIRREYNRQILLGDILKREEQEKILQNFYNSFIHFFIGKEISDEFRSGKEVALLHSFRDAFEKMSKQKMFGIKKTAELNFEEFCNVLSWINVLFVYWLTINKPENYSSPGKYISDENYKHVTKLVKSSKLNPINSVMFLLITKTNFLIERSSIYTKRNIENFFIESIKILIKHFVIKKQGDSEINRSFYSTANSFLNSEEKFGYDVLLEKFLKKIDVDLSHEIFEKQLSESNNNEWWITPLLAFTEWKMSDREIGTSEIVQNNPSLEHIMPQNPNENWLDDLKKWTNIPDINFLKKRISDNLHKIGNCLIINQRLNGKIKNNSFQSKKNDLANERSCLWKNDNECIDVSKKERWSFEEIEKRTRELVKYISKNIIVK